MYCKILYFKPESEGYGGRSYIYQTRLPLEPGDRVIAPTAGGENKAIVVNTNVPDGEISPAWAGRVREITQYDPEGNL